MTERMITSADAVFLLSILNLFNTPVQLQGWASDSAFSLDPTTPAETQMGIDGHLSAGLVMSPNKMKINLMPDSDSVDIFDTWNDAQVSQRTILFANAIITLPGTGKSYALKRGVLTSYPAMPAAKKTLQALEYEITWESITQSKV